MSSFSRPPSVLLVEWSLSALSVVYMDCLHSICGTALPRCLLDTDVLLCDAYAIYSELQTKEIPPDKS